MMRRPVTYPEAAYQTVVLPETLGDGTLVYVANHPELRGCRAQSDTPEHAQENLAEVFESYARHFAEHQLDMPAPKQKMVQAIVWRSAPMDAAWIRAITSAPLPEIPFPFSHRVPGFDRALANAAERDDVA